MPERKETKKTAGQLLNNDDELLRQSCSIIILPVFIIKRSDKAEGLLIMISKEWVREI